MFILLVPLKSMSADKLIQRNSPGIGPECINRASLTDPSSPRSDPIPISRRSYPAVPYSKKGPAQMDREDEEYKQLKQLYSFRTWIMFHRIQKHREQHEVNKVAAMIEFPGYTSAEPPSLISFVPVLRTLDTQRNNDSYYENDEQTYSDEELIFGDLED